MYFNVAQLLKEPTGFTRAVTVDEAVPDQELRGDSRIVGDVQMLRTDKGIWVEANLSREISCSCSRCLIEFGQPITMKIEEEFLPRVDVDTGARLDSSSESYENFYITQNHILDLAEAADQYVEMNVPMRPVCSAQCKGICVTCGVDLNQQECRCPEDYIDPRWGALADIARSRTPDSN